MTDDICREHKRPAPMSIEHERLRLAVRGMREALKAIKVIDHQCSPSPLGAYRELLWAAYVVCNPDVDSPLEWVDAPAGEVANDQA